MAGRREIARFDHDAWLLAEHATDAGSTLVVYASEPGSAGAVHLLRLE